MNNYIVLSHRHNASMLLVGCKGDLLDRREVSTEEIMTFCSVTRTKARIMYIGEYILEYVDVVGEWGCDRL